MPYIDASQVGPGDVLASDGSMGCIPHGERRTVECDHRGAIFVRCKCGKHCLSGELKGLLPVIGAAPISRRLQRALDMRQVAFIRGG